MSFMKKHFACLILTVLNLLLLSSCGDEHRAASVCRIDGFYFDTYVELQLYGITDEDAAKEKCRQWMEELEACFSPSEGSELFNLNHSYTEEQKEAPLSVDMRNVLSRSLYFCKLSGGAADPTIGSVSALWDFHSEAPAPPSPEAVKEQLQHVGIANMELNENGLLLKDPETRLDLGYIAKGYIADCLKEKLETELKVKSGIINLGGNVTLIGSKEDGSPWRVGIKKPFGGGEALLTIDLSDTSVVTSGVYERCFTSEDHFYHHILDPQNGFPADNGLLSVSIICEDATEADALSTACFVLGTEEGLKLIERSDGVEALFLDKDMNIRTSSGFPAFRLLSVQ